MRVLEIHCSSFSYRVKRGTSVAEQAEPKSKDLEDVLVCFICFEKMDEDRLEDGEVCQKR